MNRSNGWQKTVGVVVASLFACLLSGADCADYGQMLGRNFNPCGTILDCDPVEWDLMFHDYPDYDLDPTCTIPGLCGGTWPPDSTDVGTGGVGGGGVGGIGGLGGLGGWGGGLGGFGGGFGGFGGGLGGFGGGGYGGYGGGGYGGYGGGGGYGGYGGGYGGY